MVTVQLVEGLMEHFSNEQKGKGLKFALNAKFKIRQKVLTLKCNYNSLKICGALWDNYAYLLSN